MDVEEESEGGEEDEIETLREERERNREEDSTYQ